MRYLLILLFSILLLIFQDFFIYTSYSYIYMNQKYPNKVTNKDFVRTDVRVKVNVYSDLSSLHEGIKEYPNVDTDSVRLGLAVWDNTNTCEIHVVEPKNSEDIDTWGHELMHCVYGNWH